MSALSWEQVAQARIHDREPIPRLVEVLDGFTDCYFNIDIKSHSAMGPVLDVLRSTRSWDRVRLAAFSHPRLIALRAAAGNSVATGLSPREILTLAAGNPPRRAGRDLAAQVPSGPRWLPLVTPRFIATAHKAGMPVHVWTINDRIEMLRLIDLGVDGIMTDRADILRDLMQVRGEW
jgi:glycerophosphoryl diester phosphodiesterase